MTDLLAEQTAVVTGESSGIGRSIARTFADHGADIVVADVREEPREDGTPTHELITDETRATATYVDCDVSSVDDLESTLDEAEQFGGVDVLVNNAGLFRAEEFLEVTADQYEQLMSVNVKGRSSGPNSGPSGWSKTGADVSSTSRVLPASSETVATSPTMFPRGSPIADVRGGSSPRSDGIRVNAIHPGGIETAMMEDANMGPEALEQFTQAIPSRRIGDPADIAGAALLFRERPLELRER